MPVRKIPPKQTSLSGIHAGTGGRGTAFESSLERDFITLMVFDEGFIDIEEQPVEIPVPGKTGRAATYVPDFLVHRRNRPTMLVEIKPSEILDTQAERFADRFEAARRYANDRDWEFSIWTENEIRGLRFENAKFLLPFRDQHFDPSIARGVEARLSDNPGGESVERLSRCNGTSFTLVGSTIHTIWCLLATGVLKADLNEELSMGSVVWLPRVGAPA